jgi:cytochrome c553
MKETAMMRMALVVALSGGMMLVGPAWAAGDAAAGKDKAADACADCHGDSGKGDSDTPGIAGMSVADFTKAMKDYQSGAREGKKMAKVAKKLSDEDIADLAAYYASLPK